MAQQMDSKGVWEWQLVQLIIGLTVLHLGILFISFDWSEETIRMAIRSTARISPVLFCIAFMATSFHLFFRNSFSFWVMMNRRYWGISFAIVHLIHLFFLGFLQFTFYPVFTERPPFVIGAGGIAYLFIVLMLLTSFPAFAKKLSSKNWKTLHTLGSYWIWVIFMNSIWGRIVNGKYYYIPLGILLLFAAGLRLWHYFTKKTTSPN